jgi:hypothetical protein
MSKIQFDYGHCRLRLYEGEILRAGAPMIVGCGLVLAGLVAESLAARRWAATARPAPVDVLAVLALALPAAGLCLIAGLSV